MSRFVERENGLLQNQTNNRTIYNNNSNNSNSNKNNTFKINTEPSSFIPFEEILAIDLNKDETIAEIFSELYDGEVDNIFQIMSFHMKFFKEYLNIYNYLMYNQFGLLTNDLRHYLAIIAASRHKCFYLVKQQEKEFQQSNGNPDWLKGIEHLPQKFHVLIEINNILAHQPWLINREHLAKIRNGQLNWKVTDLILAVTILIHFHALSGFVFGCGINDKYIQLIQQLNDLNNIENIDNNNNNCNSNNNNNNNSCSTITSKEIDIIQHANNNNNNNNNLYLNASNSPVLCEINFLLKEMQMLKNEELINKKEDSKENNPILNRNFNNNNNNNNNKYSSNNNNNNLATSININLSGSGVNSNQHYSTTTSATSKTFESTINNNQNSNNNNNNGNSMIDILNNYILRYIYDPEYTHQDFRNADQTKILGYFTWEHHGYITGCEFYPEISNLLDQTFRTAYNMTYNTMGNFKSVDTSLFRRAVWIYIHSIFGIRYDDYDYNQIKHLLARPLRSYIKTVCISPERITKKDYDSIMKEFSHSEKVHINIVIMEARIQASMLYFFRAIRDNLTTNYNAY